MVEQRPRASLTMRWASNGRSTRAAAGGDDVGPEGEVGHELAVHDVPLDAVDAGLLERAELVAQLGEVGGEHGRGDLDGAGGRGGIRGVRPWMRP